MRWLWGSFKELGGCLPPKQEPREPWQKPVCGAEAHLPPAAPQPAAPHVSLTPAAPQVRPTGTLLPVTFLDGQGASFARLTKICNLKPVPLLWDQGTWKRSTLYFPVYPSNWEVSLVSRDWQPGRVTGVRLGAHAVSASLTYVRFSCLRQARGLSSPSQAPSALGRPRAYPSDHCRFVLSDPLPTPHLIYQGMAHFIDRETEVWRNDVAWPGPPAF